MSHKAETAFLCVLVGIVAFVTGVAVGSRVTHVDSQNAAVQAGAAEWVANEYGQATFQWKQPDDKVSVNGSLVDGVTERWK